MVYLKIILLKLARYFAVMIGNIIRFFRGNENIDLRTIKKIIFNRKDRIGDAVISKPFIILFSKYIKEELNLNIEIEVECSKYNEFIFKEGDGENFYKLINSDEQINNTGLNIFGLLKQQLRNLFSKKNKSNIKKDIVYIDLVGNPDHISQRKNNFNYYFIGPNLFLSNLLLDYSLQQNYVSGVEINLVQSYINLVSRCFKLYEFGQYINDNIEEFYSNYNYSKNKSGILVFIGNKEYRNLDIKVWEKLIKSLSKGYPNNKIKVIDDNSNILYKKLRQIKDFSNNVEIIENKFSLKDFKDYAKNFKLLIGIDGGGFNYIRTCSDSITIYTIGNHNVRSIFTGKNKYKETPLGNNWFLNKIVIGDKKLGYIYKKNLILPSYDIELSKLTFKDIPINDIIKKFQNII